MKIFPHFSSLGDTQLMLTAGPMAMGMTAPAAQTYVNPSMAGMATHMGTPGGYGYGM